MTILVRERKFKAPISSASKRTMLGNFVSACLADLNLPSNRLITQTCCYLLFMLWLLLTLINPRDKPGSIDPDAYDVMAAVWALGYILSDVQMMCQVTKIVS